MVKQIVLTEEEYQDLLNKSKIDGEHAIISKEDLIRYKACERSLYDFVVVRGLCPNCKEAMIIDGYICPYCGYDSSYSVEEWRKLSKGISL